MAGLNARRLLAASALGCLLVAVLAASGLAAAGQAPVAPVKDMVTVVDAGAGYCVPCRMMEPVLRDVEREYRGRAAVVFVDVTKFEAMATRLGVRVIPTQIFYDRTGREVARHEGYMDKKTLSGQLDRMIGK